MLRPNVDDTTKDLLSLDDDFNIKKLPSISYFSGVDAEELEEIRVRWSHSTEVLSLRGFNGELYGEGGRAFRASLLVSNYGAGIARTWHGDLVSLLSSSTTANKTPALAAMLTYGKDLFHAMYDGDVRKRNWGSGAGQALGKFPPALLFASLLKDEANTSIDYKKILGETSTTLLGYADVRGPHELEQVNEGPNGPVWGDDADDLTELDIGSYWKGMLTAQCFDGATGDFATCSVSRGNKGIRDPYNYIDGPATKSGSNYMSVSAGGQSAFVASMFLIPGMCEIVAYQPLVDYVIRLHNVGVQTANDPCAPPDPREDPNTCNPYEWRDPGCVYYGVTWGPDPNNPGQCITNSAGQNGRFGSIHGSSISFGYSVSQIENNWSKIVGSKTSCLGIKAPPLPPDPE